MSSRWEELRASSFTQRLDYYRPTNLWVLSNEWQSPVPHDRGCHKHTDNPPIEAMAGKCTNIRFNLCFSPEMLKEFHTLPHLLFKADVTGNKLSNFQLMEPSQWRLWWSIHANSSASWSADNLSEPYELGLKTAKVKLPRPYGKKVFISVH